MSHPEHFRESLPLFAGSPTSLLPSSSMAEHTSDKREAGGSTPSSATNVPSGDVAHARKSDGPNSHHAAATVCNLGRTREAILSILRCYGGMTDEQIAAKYEYRAQLARPQMPQVSPSGLRSRRSELVTMGFVHEVGTGKTKSGRPCAIWALKERKTL